MNDEMLNSHVDKSILVITPKKVVDSHHTCEDILLTQEEMDILPFRESAIRFKVKSTIQKNVVVVKEEFK